MSANDNHLWLQMWKDKQLDFHQDEVNSFLTRYWHQFSQSVHSRVFVPLCGKSLDLLWLAQQGHSVIAVELSDIAVKAFFDESHLTPTQVRQGDFTLWQHENIQIYCGDFFSLTPEHIGAVDIVYDRSALVALPAAVRQLYVKHLHQLVPAATDIFLLTIEDSDIGSGESEPDTIDEEIAALYSQRFDIKMAYSDREITDISAAQQALTEYKLYQMHPKNKSETS
jgi:thiopurine S-methyltransferase